MAEFDITAEIEKRLFSTNPLVSEYIQPIGRMELEPQNLLVIQLTKDVNLAMSKETLQSGIYYMLEPKNQSFSNHTIEETKQLIGNSYIFTEIEEKSKEDEPYLQNVIYDGVSITLVIVVISIAINDIKKQYPTIDIDKELSNFFSSDSQSSLNELRWNAVFNDMARTQTKKAIKTLENDLEVLTTGKTDILTPLDLATKFSLTRSTKKVMHFLHAHIEKEQLNPNDAPITIKTSIADYIAWSGAENNKENRQNIRKLLERELEILSTKSLRRNDDKRKAFATYIEFYDIKKRTGEITVKITSSFKQLYLCFTDNFSNGAYNLLTPPNFGSIDQNKNPYSMLIYDKLFSHSNMNANKDNRNILSVAKLIEYINFGDIEPKYKNRLIMKPLVRDLNKLVELDYIEYEFTHSKGEPLTVSEYALMLDNHGELTKPLDYKTAINCYINWQWTNEELVKHFDQHSKRKDASDKKARELKAEKDKHQKQINKKIEQRTIEKVSTAKSKEILQNEDK